MESSREAARTIIGGIFLFGVTLFFGMAAIYGTYLGSKHLWKQALDIYQIEDKMEAVEQRLDALEQQ